MYVSAANTKVPPPAQVASLAEFERDFSRPIEAGDEERRRLLQRMTQPFVMRRLKTDPEIAADLPEKVITARRAA